MTALRFVPADQLADYHDRIVEVMKMAYAHEGKRAFESTKRCAAIHEAGHCVVNQLTAHPDRKNVWDSRISAKKVGYCERSLSLVTKNPIGLDCNLLSRRRAICDCHP